MFEEGVSSPTASHAAWAAAASSLQMRNALPEVWLMFCMAQTSRQGWWDTFGYFSCFVGGCYIRMSRAPLPSLW